jgi:multidrug efflux pump subunit AcrB
MAQASTTAVTVGNGVRRPLVRRVVLLIASLCLIVAAMILIALIRHQQTSDRARAALVTQASADLDLENTNKLAQIVSQIKQQPGYQRDADSLYIITIYYLNTGDSANARLYYDKLASVYDAQKGYKNAALKHARSLQSLKSSVEFLASSLQEAATNSNNISPRPVKQ